MRSQGFCLLGALSHWPRLPSCTTRTPADYEPSVCKSTHMRNQMTIRESQKRRGAWAREGTMATCEASPEGYWRPWRPLPGMPSSSFTWSSSQAQLEYPSSRKPPCTGSHYVFPLYPAFSLKHLQQFSVKRLSMFCCSLTFSSLRARACSPYSPFYSQSQVHIFIVGTQIQGVRKMYAHLECL